MMFFREDTRRDPTPTEARLQLSAAGMALDTIGYSPFSRKLTSSHANSHSSSGMPTFWEIPTHARPFRSWARKASMIGAYLAKGA